MDEEELLDLLSDPEADYLFQLSVYLSSGVSGTEPVPLAGFKESSGALIAGLRNIIHSRYSPEIFQQAMAATTVTELLDLMHAS